MKILTESTPERQAQQIEALCRQISDSRLRVQTYIEGLLKEGMRDVDTASAEEMKLRAYIYDTDGVLSLVRQSQMSPQLFESLITIRDKLLQLESISRGDVPLFAGVEAVEGKY